MSLFLVCAYFQNFNGGWEISPLVSKSTGNFIRYETVNLRIGLRARAA